MKKTLLISACLAALALPSCYYGSEYGYQHTSYGSSGYSGVSSSFVVTSSDYWLYDPVVRCYYDRRRSAYYDPYLHGYYPRGYKPKPARYAPHPHHWKKGHGRIAPPHRIKSRQLVHYKNRHEQLRKHHSWARKHSTRSRNHSTRGRNSQIHDRSRHNTRDRSRHNTRDHNHHNTRDRSRHNTRDRSRHNTRDRSRHNTRDRDPRTRDRSRIREPKTRTRDQTRERPTSRNRHQRSREESRRRAEERKRTRGL